MTKKILIIDNSIRKKCERCSQFHRHFSSKSSVLHPIERDLPKNLEQYSHIILSGSGDSVNELSEIYRKLRPLILKAQKLNIPLLGICYGFQAIVATFSDFTSVEHYQNPEIGWTKIYITSPSRIFKGLPKKFYAFENHTSSVAHLPNELRKTAISHRKNVQAFEHKNSPIFGVQFHPESTTYHGVRTVNYWLKRRIPFRWFTNIHKPPRYNPEIPEKIFYNFYHSTNEFKNQSPLRKFS
jgi:GMP synthase-like glutamine amidotransferase